MVVEGASGFELERMLRMLHQHGVAYIIVGGIAAWAHGAPVVTTDLDICYEPSQPNTRALRRALSALSARVDVGEGRFLPLPNARSSEHGEMFLCETEAGPLDCLARPDGTEGYEDLCRTAVEYLYRAIPIAFASLDDLIRISRAMIATNPRRRAEEERKLALLLALQEEIDREALAGGAASGSAVLVRSYRRADGTMVREHRRRVWGKTAPSEQRDASSPAG